MEPENKGSEPLGKKHWLFQTVPPLLMLSILFFTNNGSSLIFLSGLFILPVLISFVSIIGKLFRFKKRKYFLIRPFLTIAFFFLILFIAQWTYNIAREQAIDAAQQIHDACNKELICPANPDGWDVKDSRISKNDLGVWFKYSAMYYYDKEKLIIRVYRGPDIGDNITGGVNIPFKVEPYIENH